MLISYSFLYGFIVIKSLSELGWGAAGKPGVIRGTQYGLSKRGGIVLLTHL